jgi:hypothetical protein
MDRTISENGLLSFQQSLIAIMIVNRVVRMLYIKELNLKTPRKNYIEIIVSDVIVNKC